MTDTTGQDVIRLPPKLQAAHQLIAEWADMKGWRLWTMVNDDDFRVAARQSGWCLTSLANDARRFRDLMAKNRIFAVTFWNGPDHARSGGIMMERGMRTLETMIVKTFELKSRWSDGIQLQFYEET